MRRAVGRASVALEQKGQKVGALRYASLDVSQLVGVAQFERAEYSVAALESVTKPGGGLFGFAKKPAAPPPPPPPPAHPEKITVSATVQCAFQIQ